jgi:glycosyltransferase involved in cell wall biosynthesis
MNLVYNLYDYGAFLLLKSWIKNYGKEYDEIVSCWYKLSTYLTFTDAANKTTAWEHISYKTGGLIYFKLLRHRYKKLKRIVCLTDGSLDYYTALNPNSVKIPNIIGDQFENYNFNRESKENNILLASRLDPEKNVKDFLEIIKDAELPENWTVTIAGTGIESEILKKQAKNLELYNVVFLGSVPSEKMFELFQISKIFCMTSLAEGLPTTLIEAMFCGNVLISYDCPTGPSEIINGKNGFLIPLMDKKMFKEKLMYLVNKPEALNRTMEMSFEEAKKWGKQEIIEKWTKLLQ